MENEIPNVDEPLSKFDPNPQLQHREQNLPLLQRQNCEKALGGSPCESFVPILEQSLQGQILLAPHQVGKDLSPKCEASMEPARSSLPIPEPLLPAQVKQ